MSYVQARASSLKQITWQTKVLHALTHVHIVLAYTTAPLLGLALQYYITQVHHTVTTRNWYTNFDLEIIHREQTSLTPTLVFVQVSTVGLQYVIWLTVVVVLALCSLQ